MEQNIIKQCAALKRPLPKKIANAPEIRFDLNLYYGAFLDLSSCRSSGFGEGPISWISIWDYCDRLKIFGDTRDAIFYHIRSMDNAYLKFKADKSKDKK